MALPQLASALLGDDWYKDEHVYLGCIQLALIPGLEFDLPQCVQETVHTTHLEMMINCSLHCHRRPLCPGFTSWCYRCATSAKCNAATATQTKPKSSKRAMPPSSSQGTKKPRT